MTKLYLMPLKSTQSRSVNERKPVFLSNFYSCFFVLLTFFMLSGIGSFGANDPSNKQNSTSRNLKTVRSKTSKSISAKKEIATIDLKAKVKQTLKENAETLRFMENKGQLANQNILYYFNGSNGSAYIENNRITFVANEDTSIAKSNGVDLERVTKATHTFALTLDGANQFPKINLGESFVTSYNFFLSNDSKQATTDVKAAKDLTIENVYNGVDLRLYSTKDGLLEFDWILRPGADYSKLKLHFEGQDNLSIDDNGNLKVGLRFTDVKFKIPESYQVTNTGKIPVTFAFNNIDKNTIAFQTNDKIDSRFTLVIDPVLNFGTYMDGNIASGNQFDQYLFALTVDPTDGSIYCAGASNKNIPTNSAPYTATGYLNTITGLDGAPSSGVPCAAVVYKISASGNSLLNLSLFGPASLTTGNTIQAYAISLSSNRVFIGGTTNVNLPVTANAFDNTRSGDDGFVAVFSKNLGTLNYATYLGSSGNDTRGVTAIKAIDDNSFVVGLTAATALSTSSPNFISAGAAQTTFGGSSDFYIAKFSSLNTLSFGTYVGGSGTETFNDLEILPDSRIAFCGYGTGSLTEVNSAASRSTSTDEDGILGVLNATGTTFDYLDEIGGTGADRILDVEYALGKLYWTGSASSGFPTSTGAYDVSHNGGTDVVVGTVDVAGSTGYKATFYGTSGNDLGNCIKLITQTNCTGSQSQTFLMVFGTVGATGMPVKNINGESFYDSTYNGGTDIFFAGFKQNLDTLIYGTYIGGSGNDYLGNTGDPRGANHLCINGSNIYCGTTTHSTSMEPTLLSGGFDLTKDNTSNDSHIIMGIQFTSFVSNDFGDAPVSYGTPSHIIDCNNLTIGALEDDESASQPSVNADGDDLNKTDDEDGITTLPILNSNGTQNVSVLVSNIKNTTGSTANLYGWIDFNGDGQFTAGEFTSTTIATGTNAGSATLNWSGVTVSGSASSHYLRIRLTTNNLIDNGSTSSVDERSTTAASDGEVEDYLAVELTCPSNQTEAACQTQSAINAKYATWLASVKAGGGGCTGILSNNAPASAPSVTTGGAVTVTFTYATSCSGTTPGGVSTTCSATFTVTANTNAGADQSGICAGTSASVTGFPTTGTWTAKAGNPSGATVGSTTTGVASINFSSIATGVYSFIYTANSCTDTMSVSVNALPVVSSGSSVCVGSTMTLSPTTGGAWLSSDATKATVTNSGIVTGANPGSVTFTFTNATTGCSKTTSPVTVTACINPVTENGTVSSATGGIAISNVRSNDMVNGVAATSSNSTISQGGSWPTGISLNTTTGAISVTAGTIPGAYPVTYQLCDKLTPVNCATVVDTVFVTPSINPVTENGTVSSATGGTAITNIRSNDFVNGVAATSSNSTISAISFPSGISLNTTTGAISVTAGTTPGSYPVTYQLCDKLTQVNCATIVDTVFVTPSINPVTENGTVSAATGGTAITNIRSNDFVNGVAATSSNSTISAISFPSGISLNTTTGAISVIAGTTPGSYPVTYQLCDKLTPVNCATIVDTVFVTPSINPVTENGTVSSATGGTAITNIRSNDFVNGVAATSSNSTISAISFPSGISLNTTTGAISVTAGTTPGSYPVTYQLCDKLTPVNCVTVVDTVFVTMPPIIANNDTNQTVINTPVSGDVSTNDTYPSGSTFGTIGTPSNGGNITMNNDGTYTYTPATGFVGTDTVSYSVCNGVICDTAILYIVIDNCYIPAATVSAGSSLSFCQGGSVILSSSFASTYQWYNNGVAISGATNQTYTATISGSYTVVTTNATGCISAVSTPVVVTVNALPSTPSISAAATTTCAGGSMNLTSSSATGNQWYKDGVAISGATAQTYLASASGDYRVIVTTNGCSSSASSATTVTISAVLAPPAIKPADTAFICVANHDKICPADSSWGWSNYQWYKNGLLVPAPEGTSSCFYPSEEGSYTLTAQNGAGCWTTQSLPVYVVIDTLCNHSVSSGTIGGVESKTLGDLIAVRLYGNAINSVVEMNGYSNAIKFNNSGAVVNGIEDISLSKLMPSTIVNTDAAYVSTPSDLINFTNAVEVLAIDYAKGNTTRAVAFGTKTLGDIYGHTKPICDRLKGAELLEVKNVSVNGYALVAYKIRQRTGETEYAINLSAGTAANRNTISLQSNWFTDSYQQDEKLYNFQLWAVSYEMVTSMANDIITKLQSNGTVNSVTNADLPKAYISKGNRKATDLNLTFHNNTTNTSGYFELKEKANENSQVVTRQIPFTVNSNGTTNITIPVKDNYEGNIYVYLNNKLTDLVYLADGTWSISYDKNTTSISKFDVLNETNVTTNSNEHRLFRNVNVTATTKDYVTIYKTMMGGGLEQNVSAFKSILFNANATGAGSVKVTLIKKSITNWDDQYTYTLNLDGDKEYGINLSQFKSSKYISEINANDITAINFSFINSRGSTITMNISLSKARFSTANATLEVTAQAMTLYPNPTTGRFTTGFASETAQPLVLKVIETATGKTVKTVFVNATKGANQTVVTLDNITSTNGLYIVTLEGDNTKYNPAKLIVNRK